MALSANYKFQTKTPPIRMKCRVTSGTIHIYEGALLNFHSNSDTDAVKLAGSTNGERFAGISVEELNLAAADNTAVGDFEVEVIAANSGEFVLLNFSNTLTRGDVGKGCYAAADDEVTLMTDSVNTNESKGQVGVLREYVSSSSGWVQLMRQYKNAY